LKNTALELNIFNHDGGSPMRIVLGLDFGTQGVKGVLADTNGRITARAYQEYPTMIDDGRAEQNCQNWLSSLKKVISLLAADFDLSSIEGIGLSGQMHGFVAVDPLGMPLYPAVIWLDNRSKKECEDFDIMYRIQGYPNPYEPVYTAPKLRWFKKTNPEIYRQTYKFLFPKDYIKWVLCGCFTTDHTDASASLLYDFAKGCWDPELVSAAGLDIGKLPDIEFSDEPCGTVTEKAGKQFSLPSGIPVTGGLADISAGLYGSQAGQNDLLAMISSSGQLLCYTQDTSFLMGTHVFKEVNGGYYRLASIPAAGLSLKWLRNQLLGGETTYRDMDNLCSAAAPCEVLFAPYLQGTGSPQMDTRAAGCFAGLREYHTMADMIRAVMEGVTFSMRQAAETLSWTGSLVISGGGGTSLVWRQIFADVFQCPVCFNAVGDASSYGAAQLALKMLDITMPVVFFEKNTLYPSLENADLYQKQYKLFLELYPSLGKIYAGPRGVG
jgi:xylulokinase